MIYAQQIDPSGTALLRRSYAAELRRRFSIFQKKVWAYVVAENHLRFGVVTTNANELDLDPNKLAAFNRWLGRAIHADILHESPLPPWPRKFVDQAYKSALGKAYDKTKLRPALMGSRDQFVYTATLRPIRVKKIRTLYMRAFENLKGITSSMSAKMSEEFANGMIQEKTPTQIGRMLAKTVKKLGTARAIKLAQNEIVAVNADGILDGLEDLGQTKVGIQAEYRTSGLPNVCPLCADMEGRVFTIAAARGIIPQHPGCACSWEPITVIGRKKKII